GIPPGRAGKALRQAMRPTRGTRGRPFGRLNFSAWPHRPPARGDILAFDAPLPKARAPAMVCRIHVAPHRIPATGGHIKTPECGTVTPTARLAAVSGRLNDLLPARPCPRG